MKIYYETEDFTAKVNEVGEHVFIHLDVKKYSKGALKKIRVLMEAALSDYESKGHLALFAVTDDEKVLKFWNQVKKCDHVKKFGPHNEYYLGAWETENKDGN